MANESKTMSPSDVLAQTVAEVRRKTAAAGRPGPNARHPLPFLGALPARRKEPIEALTLSPGALLGYLNPPQWPDGYAEYGVPPIVGWSPAVPSVIHDPLGQTTEEFLQASQANASIQLDRVLGQQYAEGATQTPGWLQAEMKGSLGMIVQNPNPSSTGGFRKFLASVDVRGYTEAVLASGQAIQGGAGAAIFLWMDAYPLGSSTKAYEGDIRLGLSRSFNQAQQTLVSQRDDQGIVVPAAVVGPDATAPAFYLVLTAYLGVVVSAASHLTLVANFSDVVNWPGDSGGAITLVGVQGLSYP